MLNTGKSDLRLFCAKNSSDMPWSTSNRIVQNAAYFFFSPPLGKSLNIIEEYEGLSLIDTSFAPRDSPRTVNEKLAMSPSYPLTLVMRVSMISNIHSLPTYCEQHSRGKEFGFLNQPVYLTQEHILVTVKMKADEETHGLGV